MNRYNIPSYMRNVKQSSKGIVREQMKNLMPSLSNTIVTNKTAFNEIKSFNRTNGRQYVAYVNKQKHLIFGPLKDFIRNAKQDLKSGKFYNEERITEYESNAMDDMLSGFGDIDDHDLVDDNDLEEVRITSRFDKYLKSTNRGLSIGNRALSNSINEVNINNTEYMANISTINTTKFMALTSRHHMEQMKQMKNLENIGMSMMKFNETVIASAIERQDRFHEEILAETRELKDILREQTELNMARFKSGASQSTPMNPLEKIMGSHGSINIKEYMKNIKKNISKEIPISGNDISLLFKEMSGSPISMMLNLLLPGLIPKNIKRSMRDLDTGLSSIFARYLLKMNDVKNHGKDSTARFLASILGVDFKNYNKPNLSIYKNQDMTLEIEQKKAKAITEVIPTYLREITNAMTGINKIYDYSRGVFVDKRKRTKELYNMRRSDLVSDLYETNNIMERNMAKLNINKNQYKVLKEDKDEFMYFLQLFPELSPSMSYSQFRKFGLKLKGGEKSFKLIQEMFKSTGKNGRMIFDNERLSSLSRRAERNYEFNNYIQQSGDSAIYNQFNDDDDYYEPVRSRSYSRSSGGYRLNRNISSNGRKYRGTSSLNNIDIDQFKQELIREMSSEEISRRQKQFNKDEYDDVDAPSQSSAGNVRNDIYGRIRSNSKIRFLEKIWNKYQNSGAPVATILDGINNGIYKILYGEDKTKRGIIGKISDFTSDVLDTTKTVIFGGIDKATNENKEGILPKEVADQVKRYLPKARNGVIVGGLFGLTVKNPLLGAIAGASINILAETDKIKKFLWGEPGDKNRHGLFGGLKYELNKNIINPLKDMFRSKFGSVKDKIRDKSDEFDEKIDDFFAVNVPGMSKKSPIASMRNPGKVGRLYRSDNSVSNMIYDMEQGIYSNQLNTIISLLSNGFGFTISQPNTARPTITTSQTSTSSSASKSEPRYRLSNKSYSFRSKPRTSSNNTVYSSDLGRDLTPMDLVLTSQETNTTSVSNSMTVSPITEREILETAIARNAEKDPRIRKYINDKLRSLKKFIEKSHDKIKEKESKGSIFDRFKGSNGKIDFNNIKSLLSDKFALDGIGKGRGGLIGLALGSMLLGNPLLGAIAGMTFTGKSVEQHNREFEQGGSKLKPGRTAMKYGLISTMLGMGPMPGILMGALLPQKKKDDSNEKPGKLSSIMNGSSKLLGGLAGLALGGVPGMLIGGAVAGKAMGMRNAKRDHDAKYKKVENPETGQIELVERTKEERKEYIRQRREEEKVQRQKRQARGSIVDMFTGGGKLKGGQFGALAGLALGGLPGLALGGLAGTVLGTSRNKLDRDKTGGILQKQGKWKSAVLGAIAGNLLMGPLIGPVIGSLAGSMLAKKTDNRFWRYDDNGKLLSKEKIATNKKNFKNQYKYEHGNYDYDMYLFNSALANGEATEDDRPDPNDPKYSKEGRKRGFWEARKERKSIMKRENDLRDKLASNDNKSGKKFDLEKLELFQGSKAKGALKGSIIGSAFGGPLGMLAGGVLGALTHGKKNKQPDGSRMKPFFVKDVSSSPKSHSNPEGNDSKEENKLMKSVIDEDSKKGDAAARAKLTKEGKKILQSGKSTTAAQSVVRASEVVSGLQDTGSGLVSDTVESSDNKNGGFLNSLLGGLLGGGLSGILPLIIKGVIGVGLPMLAMWFANKAKKNGAGGHDTVNEYGDAQHANWTDNIKNGAKLMLGKSAAKVVAKTLGAGKIAGFTTSQSINALTSSGYYGKEAKAYSDQGDDTGNVAEARYGQVTNLAKAGWYGVKAAKRLAKTKAGQSVAKFVVKNGTKLIKAGKNKIAATAIATSMNISTNTGVVAKIINGTKSFIDKLLKHSKVAKLLEKAGGKAGSVASKIGQWVSEKLGSKLVKSAGEVLGKIIGKISQIVSVVLAWLPLITAVTAFINGWNNVSNELQLSSDYKPAWWERLTCGLVYALDDFLCGVIDMFGLRDNLISLLIRFFGGEKKANEIAESKAKASEEYEKFLQENDLNRDGFTMEMYQNMTNKTIWGHVKSVFGGNNLDDYKKGGKKYDKIHDKYGGYSALSDGGESSDLSNYLNENSEDMQKLSGTNTILMEILNTIKTNGTGESYVIQNNQKTWNIQDGSLNSGTIGTSQMLDSLSGGRGNSTKPIKTNRDVKSLVRSAFKEHGGRGSLVEPLVTNNSETINIGSKIPKKYNNKISRIISGGRGSFGSGGRFTKYSGRGTSVSNTLFIGDSYMCVGNFQNYFKGNGNQFKAKSGTVPEYWYGKIGGLSNVNKVFMELGLNLPNKTSDQTMFKLIEEVKSSYPNAQIIVTKIPRLGRKWKGNNNDIDKYNENLQNWCSGKSNITFVDTVGDLIGSDGYLKDEYVNNNDGIHLVSAGEAVWLPKVEAAITNTSTSLITASTPVSTSSTPISSTPRTNLSTSSNVSTYNKSLALLKSRARKPKIETTRVNSTPEETIIQTTGSDGMKKVLQTAYENRGSFLSDKNISKNSNISVTSKPNRNADEISNSFSSKLIDGVKSLGSNIISGAKSLGSKAWNGIKNGASWVGGKIKGAWNWLTGGRGDDPDYYNQQDPRWGNMNFGRYDGHRDTVADGGCGPTTAATVLQKMTGKIITPAETSKFALQNGYKVDNGGTTPDYFNALGSKYGVGFNQSDPTSSDTISSLRQGKPVIFLGHDSTGTSPFGNDSHYVIGTGMDRNGNISVLDPKNSYNNGTYNINDITTNAMRSIVPQYSGGRGKSKPVRSSNNRSRHIMNKTNRYLSKNKFSSLYGGRGTSSNPGNAIVEVALKMKGKITYTQNITSQNGANGCTNRFSLGDTKEDRWNIRNGWADCSSFAAWIYYTVLGIDIGSTTYEQINKGTAVITGKSTLSSSDLSKMQPGDLILSKGHVGIYIGNGQVINECGDGKNDNSLGLSSRKAKLSGENGGHSSGSVANKPRGPIVQNVTNYRNGEIEQVRRIITGSETVKTTNLGEFMGCDGDKYTITINGSYSTGNNGSSGSASSKSNPALVDHDGFYAPELVHGFPWYSQSDSRWGSQTTHGSSVMSTGGCGPTSLACILTSYGVSMDPSMVNKALGSSGYVSGKGISWEAGHKILKNNGLEVSGSLSWDQALEKVKQGIPVWMSQGNGKSLFTGGGHMTVLSGYDNGKVYVTDPANNPTGSATYRASKYFELCKDGNTAKSAKKISSIPIDADDVKAGYDNGWAVSKNGKGSIGNVGSGGSSGSSSSGSSSPGNRLLNKISGILDKIVAPSTSVLNNVISGIHTAWDNSTTSAEAADNTSSSSTSSSSTTSGSVSGKDRSASFGTTSRNGTITLPDGLGKTRTYMGWQCVTAKSSDQYKLREESGMHFDDLGYAKIGDRYVVAMTSTFGKVGDYVDIYRTDGSVLHAVIGDEKSQQYVDWDHNPANKWGHLNGQCVEEFVVDKNTWYTNGKGTHSNPGQASDNHPEWKNIGVSKVENLGNYWGRGGLSSKVNKKQNLVLNRFNKSRLTNPFNKSKADRLITSSNINGGGFGDPVDTGGEPYIAPSTMLSAVSKYGTFNPIVKHKDNYGGRGITPIPTTSSVIDALSLKNHNSIINSIDDAMKSSNNNSSSSGSSSLDVTKLDEGNKITNAILGVLKGIASTLERIERNSAIGGNSINTLSYQNGGGSMIETYKASMMNSIVSGN